MNTDCIFVCETIQQSCNTNLLNESEGEDDCDNSNLLEEGFVNIHTPLIENVYTKEDEEANEYVNQFMGTDLDPTTPGDEGEMYDDITQQDQDDFIHNINEIG